MRVEKKTKHLHIEFIVTSHNSVAIADPGYGRSVNPISRGAHHITACPPSFR